VHLRLIPGGRLSPGAPAAPLPPSIFSQPGPDPGFFYGFALALGPCLLFWAALGFGIFALVH
jgi:hypothetical protein